MSNYRKDNKDYQENEKAQQKEYKSNPEFKEHYKE
jgi:hypothetical protein